MESFVKQLLKDADLTVVTKKHVRMKYKEHVGRELLPEEKSKINDMVYAFVKELSAAVQQESPKIDTPVTTPNSKDESPGNKENKQSNQKPNRSTFIIKGQVVDRNDLYKSKSKEKKNASPDGKQKGDEVRKKNEATSKTRHETTASSKQHAAAARLRINEVMSAVLGSDKGESSSEVSSVSSLTDTSLSEGEEEEAPEAEERINEALQKLKAARDKKIQMSIEKKSKSSKEKKGNKSSKARRSLAMGDQKLKDQNASEDSEAVSIISISSVTGETAEESNTDKNMKKDKKVKSVKHLIKTDSDSSELKVKRTPNRYNKRKALTAAKFDDLSEKKKKLVKRKRKKIEDSSESDSDSDDSEPSLNQRQIIHKKKSTDSKKVFDLDDDTGTDSENETLNKIAAKKSVKCSSTKNGAVKEKKVAERKKREPVTKDTAKSSEEDNDSESSTGDTPLAKKGAKGSKLDSDSEHSTGDTPLARKKMKKQSVLGSDSESETGDTPLANKRTKKANKINNKDTDKQEVKVKRSKNSIKEKDLRIEKEDSKKSAVTERKLSENEKVSELSESSSGDTPLAQIKRNKKTMSESVHTEEVATEKKTKTKKSLGYDSDGSTGDTPLKKKQENFKLKSADSDAKASTGEKPLEKKTQKLKRSHDLKTDGKHNQKDNISEKTSENSEDGIKGGSDVQKNSVVKQTSKKTKLSEDISLSIKRKRKLAESSESSTGDTSVFKKDKKQKLEKTSSKENESELSDVSTGDTPLVKKTFRLRSDKTKVQLDISLTEKGKQHKSKKSNEIVTVTETQDSDTCKSEEFVQEMPDETGENYANCDNITENDSPLKIVKKHRKKRTELESTCSSDEDSSVKKTARSKRFVKKKITRDSQPNGTSNPSKQTSEHSSSDSGADSDDSDDLPLAQFSKQTMETKVHVYDLSSDSEDDIPLSKTKAAQSKLTDKDEKNKKEPTGPVSDAAYVRQLRQICRECQMFVRNDRELAGCTTDREKIEKMEQMLRAVGMKGKPSLKKAEEVKLMKEAKELSADNIISSETGRVMRKVKSIWARRTISPVKPAKPKGGDPFVGLKDIVDSEGTESG